MSRYVMAAGLHDLSSGFPLRAAKYSLDNRRRAARRRT